MKGVSYLKKGRCILVKDEIYNFLPLWIIFGVENLHLKVLRTEFREHRSRKDREFLEDVNELALTCARSDRITF